MGLGPVREGSGSGSQLQQRALREGSDPSVSLEERVSQYEFHSVPSLPWDDALSTGDQDSLEPSCSRLGLPNHGLL